MNDPNWLGLRSGRAVEQPAVGCETPPRRVSITPAEWSWHSPGTGRRSRPWAASPHPAYDVPRPAERARGPAVIPLPCPACGLLPDPPGGRERLPCGVPCGARGHVRPQGGPAAHGRTGAALAVAPYGHRRRGLGERSPGQIPCGARRLGAPYHQAPPARLRDRRAQLDRGANLCPGLGRHRRLSKDYAFRVQSSEALITIAACALMLKRIAPS
jgi:hypothetical protein